MSCLPLRRSIKFPCESKYKLFIVKSLLFASSFKLIALSTNADLPKEIKSFLKLVIWYSFSFIINEIVLYLI